jgi:hypothetical protein
MRGEKLDDTFGKDSYAHYHCACAKSTALMIWEWPCTYRAFSNHVILPAFIGEV